MPGAAPMVATWIRCAPRSSRAVSRRLRNSQPTGASTWLQSTVRSRRWTECWVSRDDGTAFPVAPGVAGGRFDPERYALLNLGAADVQRDMDQFITALRRRLQRRGIRVPFFELDIKTLRVVPLEASP